MIITLLFIAASVVVVAVVVIAGKWFRSDYSPWRYVKNLLFTETPFSVVSPLSPAEAERRLKDQCSRIAVPFLMSRRLIGQVANRTLHVGLHRPFVSNSFAPIFVGSIRRSNDQTCISGVFRLRGFVRIFMTIWFGFIIFWSAFGIPSGIIMLIGGKIEGAMFVVVPFAMFGFGVVFLKVGVKLGETNQHLIQDKITEIVGGTVIQN